MVTIETVINSIHGAQHFAYACDYILLVYFDPLWTILSFYCATLCVSAVFARTMSVCPSVTLLCCTHVTEDIVKILSRSGSPVILVFLTHSGGTQFQGELLQRGRKIHGDETVLDRALIAMER